MDGRVRRNAIAGLLVVLALQPLNGLHAAGAAVVGGQGTPVAGDFPVVGDWNGDGRTTIGIRRGATFYLRNENTTGPADLTFDFGIAGDVPLAGDWNGDGTTTVGVHRRPAEFYLRNSNTTGTADTIVTFGLVSDVPIVGDWNGDGTTTIGVYRGGPTGGTFFLRNSNTSGPADIVVNFESNGQPIVGDWDGNGTTTVGVYYSGDLDPSPPTFYARNSNTSGPPELKLAYGIHFDTGVAGDWDGDGIDSVGIRRDAAFYLTNTPTPDVSANGSAVASIVASYGYATEVFKQSGP